MNRPSIYDWRPEEYEADREVRRRRRAELIEFSVCFPLLVLIGAVVVFLASF